MMNKLTRMAAREAAYVHVQYVMLKFGVKIASNVRLPPRDVRAAAVIFHEK